MISLDLTSGEIGDTFNWNCCGLIVTYWWQFSPHFIKYDFIEQMKFHELQI